ncbi:MAG: hypothetical protein ACE5Q6_07610 [Dehalococcoidia bacterium]
MAEVGHDESIILSGDATGEHLRADVKGEDVALVSHELAVGRITSHWRERVLVSLPKEMWLAVAQAIALGEVTT